MSACLRVVFVTDEASESACADNRAVWAYYRDTAIEFARTGQVSVKREHRPIARLFRQHMPKLSFAMSAQAFASHANLLEVLSAAMYERFQVVFSPGQVSVEAAPVDATIWIFEPDSRDLDMVRERCEDLCRESDGELWVEFHRYSVQGVDLVTRHDNPRQSSPWLFELATILPFQVVA